MTTPQEVVRMTKGQVVPIGPSLHNDRHAVQEFCLDPVKVAIARFTDEDIRKLSHADLVEYLEGSGEFSGRAWTNSLRLLDQIDLCQLAYLARRRCRQVVNDAYQRYRQQIPFQNDEPQTV